MVQLRYIMMMIMIVAGCHESDEQGSRRHGGLKEVPVVTQTIKLVEEPRWVTTITQLQGKQQVDVYPRVAGRLTGITRSEGERINQGSVLFKVQRQEPGENFLSTPITSPISGWVGRWLVRDIGEQVTAKDPVVTVVDDEQLKAVTLLPYADWLQVSKDTMVRVIVSKMEKIAKVTSIARAADARSGQGRVEVELDNKDHKLKAGVVATVHFGLDKKERLLLNASSLVLTDTGSFVYVIEDSKAKKVAVDYRLIDNDNVEITEGLTPGQTIVTVGANQLSDDAHVKIVEPKEKAAASREPVNKF